MSSKSLTAIALYIIGLLIALVSLVLAYGGLAAGYDTEPLLAVAVLLVAGAGIISIKD